MVHSPTAHWSDRAFYVLFPLRVYPYCTIKLRFNREQEQKRTKGCMKRCSCFFASRICRPSKTDANSFVFICMNKNTAKTRRFSVNILGSKPGVYKLYTATHHTLWNRYRYLLKLFWSQGYWLHFSPYALYFLFLLCSFLPCISPTLPPEKERRSSLWQPSFCWYSPLQLF